MKKLARALALVLLAATPAFAGDPHEDKKAAVAFLACITVVPLALFPLGLAFQLLLRALAPRKSRVLVQVVESQPVKSALLGFTNAFLVWLVILATLQGAPVIGISFFLLFVVLAGAGLHGVAGSLGARIVGDPIGPRNELKELAVGWFVLVYVACFPVIGWGVGAFWLVRAFGASIITILQALEHREERLRAEATGSP